MVVGWVDLLLSVISEPGDFGLRRFIFFLCFIERMLETLFFVLRISFFLSQNGQDMLRELSAVCARLRLVGTYRY